MSSAGAPGSRPSVAVAIPAYNEADGIAGFIAEIDAALAPVVSSLKLVVVDDASSDGTSAMLRDVEPTLSGDLEILANDVNRGHGPSVIAAYRRALELGPDFVLQVDGDGQFLGSDLRRVLVLLTDDAHAVSGVRRFRQDPWFRMAMTRLVRSYVNASFGAYARDPNCPLRGYDAAVLQNLLPRVPDDSLVPNLYLTILASRSGLPLLEFDVAHRVRRGRAAQGTTWGARTRSPIPWRLVRFSLAALVESRAFARRIGPPRSVHGTGLPRQHQAEQRALPHDPR
ncbi:MAG TPA: glycosyltransferase family 2 protein [Solirubrobacteraceae bacterium]|jgi:glycosyltransferase involved in cell wall biosynthesis